MAIVGSIPLFLSLSLVFTQEFNRMAAVIGGLSHCFQMENNQCESVVVWTEGMLCDVEWVWSCDVGVA